MPLLGPSNYSRGRTVIRSRRTISVAPTKRQLAASKIQKAWRARRSVPSRIGRSAATYNHTRQVVNQTLQSISENKFRGLIRDGCVPPVGKPAGSQPISYHFFNTGKDLSSLLTEFPNGTTSSSQGEMNMFFFPQGTGKTNRVGDAMYIRNCNVKMEVQMKSNTDIGRPANPTVSFRLMVIKSRRALNAYGTRPDPGDSLFLTTTNGSFGYDSTTVSTFMNMNQPINKRNWIVYKDTKFTLSSTYQDLVPLGGEGTPFVNSKYPNKRFLNFKLPVYKKCNFDSEDHPSNLDTQWFIILQAVNTNYCEDTTERPQNYAVNMVATTTALDN